MMNKCDAQCMCDIDFSNDNGYKYILDELKATRAHIDEIIKIIESRIEKDAVIDKVLNTEYPDEDDLLCGLSEAVENKEIKEKSKIQPLDIDTLIKVAAINNVLNGPIRRTPYPWNLNTYF